MDYQDSFPSAPVRYAFDDEDSDDEGVVPLPPVQVESTATLTPQHTTLIVGLSGPGSVLLRSLKGNLPTLGHIEANDKGTIYTVAVLQVSASAIGLVFPTQPLPTQPADYTTGLFKALGGSFERIILLDSFTAADYTSTAWGTELQPPMLRTLQTHCTPTIALVPYEAPNMVKGLSAALLSHCEIHAIPCYSLLTLQESMLGKLLVTQDTLDGYHEGLTALGLRLDYDEQALSRVLSSDTKSRVDEHHHRLYL